MADGVQVEGVDYAWSRPDIAQLAAAGKRFACRYGGPGSSGKQLDPGEAQALSAAGVAIVANAEGSADGLIGGWSVGVDWARRAEAHFAACGMPPGRPIYFSVDFDVQSGQWAAVRSALDGAASVLGGVRRVGVYGSYDAMVWARRDGAATWFWQTYAWSGGRWVPGNHIEQYRNGVTLAGASLDLDRALASDFGQWTTTGDGMSWEQVLNYPGTPQTNPNGYQAGQIHLATNQAAFNALGEIKAFRAEDQTRDAVMLAAIKALAGNGGPDAAPIVAAIKAEGELTRELVEARHQEEMAALNREHEAEVAGLRAELERLTAGTQG